MKKTSSTSPTKRCLRYFGDIMLLVSISLFFSTCKKTTAAVTSSFVWTYGSTSYTANIKGAYTQSLSITPVILAGTGNSLSSIGIGPRIFIPLINVGTYTLTSGVYHIDYLDDQGNSHKSVSGSIIISVYDYNGISGSFTTTLTNNIVLTGSFTAVPVSQ